MTSRLRGVSSASAGQARVALAFSLVAAAVAVSGLILLGGKLTGLSRRIAALEARPAPAPVANSPAPAPPPPPEEAIPLDKETGRKVDGTRIRQLVEKENRDLLDALAKKLGLERSMEAGFQECFREEFEYYVEGVVRGFETLARGDSRTEENWLASPKFRKGLSDRVEATDARVRSLLTDFQKTVFELWRIEVRKDRYELD